MISRPLFHGGVVLAATGAASAIPQGLRAQTLEEILLWPGFPPGQGGVTGPERIGGEGSGYGAVSNISNPLVRVYKPNIGNGKSVIVCGGGYFHIQLWKESTPVSL